AVLAIVGTVGTERLPHRLTVRFELAQRTAFVWRAQPVLDLVRESRSQRARAGVAADTRLFAHEVLDDVLDHQNAVGYLNPESVRIHDVRRHVRPHLAATQLASVRNASAAGPEPRVMRVPQVRQRVAIQVALDHWQTTARRTLTCHLSEPGHRGLSPIGLHAIGIVLDDQWRALAEQSAHAAQPFELLDSEYDQ